GMAADPNRPAKVVVGDQSEITEIRSREEFRVSLEKRAQHRFRKNLRSHGPVEEKIEIILRPSRHLGASDRIGTAGAERMTANDRQGDCQDQSETRGTKPRPSTSIHPSLV